MNNLWANYILIDLINYLDETNNGYELIFNAHKNSKVYFNLVKNFNVFKVYQNSTNGFTFIFILNREIIGCTLKLYNVNTASTKRCYLLTNLQQLIKNWQSTIFIL